MRRSAVWLLALVCAWISGLATVQAQTIYPPINSPVFRALDDNGHPLAGGMLYTYAAGSSTPLTTYASADGTAPNTNPVVLDANGSAKVFLGPSVYKFVLVDANGVQQWTIDSISGKPALGAVTSVFGRTGGVTAVTGDYTCSQVTGAVCSLPTLHYQSVAVAGTAVTQRDTLNFLSGTGATVTCVDNSANDSTDCTVAQSSGGSITPRTCNANGCYRIEADGTIEAWGNTGNTSGSGSIQPLTATFPYAFTNSSNLTVTVSAVGTAIGDGSDHPIECHVKSFTTTGISAVITLPVQVSGSGYDHLSSSQYCTWHAIGY